MAHSVWSEDTNNDLGKVTMLFDLAVAGAAQGFSPVIDEIKVRSKTKSNGQYVSFSFNASAVTGADLDIALYGCDNDAGTDKYLLLDAIVADITATGKVTGIIDIQAYPAPFYFISVTGAHAETGNTLRIDISGDFQ